MPPRSRGPACAQAHFVAPTTIPSLRHYIPCGPIVIHLFSIISCPSMFMSIGGPLLPSSRPVSVFRARALIFPYSLLLSLQQLKSQSRNPGA